MKLLHPLASIVVGFALLATCADAQSWSQLSPSGTTPAARGFQGTTGVYDAASDRMIVFGGRDTNGDNLNDVWILTNANGLGGTSQWINLIANGDPASPPARSGHSAVYDAADNIMMIFGGCAGSCSPALNDVWVLSNANGLGGTPAWSQLNAGSGPAARTNAAAAYDQTHNQMIVFGGQDGSADPCSTFSDVWVLTNANGLGNPPVWLSPGISTVNNATAPAGQNAAAAAYNPVGGVMTIFGGTGMVNGVCTASNALSQLSVTQSSGPAIWFNIIPEGASGSPPARSSASAVYDSTGGRFLLFGGADASGNYLNDVWALSNVTGFGSPTWAILNPTGGPPAARSSQAAIFDSANQRMTIFAGSGASGVLNDAWVLTAPGISGLACTATAGNPNIVRAEGIAERVGDFVLNCSGGTPTPQGQPIPEYTVQLTLSTGVTSRALPEAANLSEALLDIDEPFPATPDPSYAVPVPGAPSQILCTPLGATCSENGTGGTPSPYQTQPNIFVGTQTSANSLSWNIPIDPPGVNGIRIIRLTNVRANASALGTPSGLLPTTIQATVAVQGSPAVPIASPQQVVALGQSGPVVSVNASNPILQCAPHNAALLGGSGTAAFDFSAQVQEAFGQAFKFRNYGTTLSGPVFPPQLAEQNVFGIFYDTESGFYSPSLFTTAPTLGLADFGTRIRVEFQGVNSGTHLFVPVTLATLAPFCNSPGPSCNVGELQLVQADQNGDSPAGYEPVLATQTIGTAPVAEVNYSGSTAYTTYEVINASAAIVEHAVIPVAVAFSSSNPPAAGSVTVDPSFAPLSSVMTADLTAPLPRFVDFGTPQPAYAINSCACTYSLTLSSASISASGGNGSFTVTTSQGCPIQPVSQSSFVSFTVAGSVVSYTVAPNSLPYPRTATITVGGQSFTLTQAAAALTFTPSQLKFTSGPVTAPPAQTVNVSGWQGSFTVSVDVPWATVTSNSQQLPATLTVAVSPAGLQPGSYNAAITLNANGSLATYLIQYTVVGLPSLVAVPSQLTFNYAGGAPPASQQLEIYSTSPVAFQASGSGFVSVTPASGTTTQKITVSVDTSTLGPGAHAASVTVTASGVTNSPLVILVTLNVFSTGPQFTSASVVNAASFLAGPMAPGSLFTVFGANLASSQTSASGPALQTSLDGVSMSINGISVPLQFVSPGQVNAQVPFEVAPGQQPLVVTSNGMSTELQVTIVPAAPGIFLVNGRGAILNQDSSLNSSMNPALSGTTAQVFFTGQGLVNQPAVTGDPASLTTLAYTSATTTATVGTEAATVTFSGLAPGLIGVGQANVQMPSLPTNDYPLVLTVNGISSNSVTIAVKTP